MESDRRSPEDRRVSQNLFNEILLNTIPGPVFYKGVDGKYLGCNKAFEAFFNVTREWLIGKTVYDLAPVEIAAEYYTSDEEIMLSGGCHVFEGKAKPVGSNETRDIFVHKSTFNDINGDVVGLVGVVTDVTELTQSRKLLQEANTNFHRFFCTVDDLMLVGTSDGTILYANEACERKLEYTKEELLGMNLIDLHPEDKREEAGSIFAAMINGDRESCPLPLQSRYGRLIPVETRIWLGKWSGKPSIFGISKDLSEEQEAHQKFERLFRSNPALMALSSAPQRRFLDVNDTFIRTLGYSKEELIGRTAAEVGLFPFPEDQKIAADKLENEKSINNVELQARCKNGTIITGLFSGEAIYSQGKENFLTVMIDITEKKKIEIALEKSEKRFRRMTEHMNDMICELDLDGFRKYVSPSYKTITGSDYTEYLGVHFLSHVHPEDVDRVKDKYKSCIDKQQSGLLEYRLRISSGKYIWVEANGSPVFDENNNLVGAVIVSRDITCKMVEKQKRIEAERKLKEVFTAYEKESKKLNAVADAQAHEFQLTVASALSKMNSRRLARGR